MNKINRIKIFSISCILLCFISCKNTSKTTNSSIKELPPYSAKVAENAVIYEVNIRQYSPEGTIQAFTQDIPKLKKLGVKILWIMPIQPISMKKRKATPALSIEDIKDPQKKPQYLGSYYAIADYTAVNPNYGSLADFQELVKTAHQNGIYVILDWVANHTGWDNKWMTEHPDFYLKNKTGNITQPLDPKTQKPLGWTDVAELDYHNPKLYKAMTNAMLYWVKKANIDGFRCDVASHVPLDFWKYARQKITQIKPVFMLMEADKSSYFSVFDMGYNWQLYHLINALAIGEKTVADFDTLMQKLDTIYPHKAIMMNFTSNHDENAWAGSVFKRLGKATETFAALTYMIPGMPLIYDGQEYDLNKSLKFFQKDSFPHHLGKMYPIYTKLGKLKNTNPALNGGVNKASYQRITIPDNPNILAFKRQKGGHTAIYIANLSQTQQKFSLPISGTYTNYMKGEKITLKGGESLSFKPWEYLILTN